MNTMQGKIVFAFLIALVSAVPVQAGGFWNFVGGARRLMTVTPEDIAAQRIAAQRAADVAAANEQTAQNMRAAGQAVMWLGTTAWNNPVPAVGIGAALVAVCYWCSSGQKRASRSAWDDYDSRLRRRRSVTISVS